MQLELHCPDCSGANLLNADDLFDGMPTGCLHFGTELVLSREWDEFNDVYQWQLLPEKDYVDEE